jgi:thiamine phosphate synthase YjbQ (UPF0047 family)
VKAHTEYLTFNTKKKRDLVHLTEIVSEIVAKMRRPRGRLIVKALGF